MATSFIAVNMATGEQRPITGYLRANWSVGLDRITQANWEFPPNVDLSYLQQYTFVQAVTDGRVEFQGIVETHRHDYQHPTLVTASSLAWCLTGRTVAWKQGVEGRTQFSQKSVSVVIAALVDSNLRNDALASEGRNGDGRWSHPSWAASELAFMPDPEIDFTAESNANVWATVLRLCDEHTLIAHVVTQGEGSELQPKLVVRNRPYGQVRNQPLVLGDAFVVERYTYTDSVFQHVNRVYVSDRTGEDDEITVVQGDSGTNASLREAVINTGTGQDTPTRLGHGELDRSQDRRQEGDIILGHNPNFQYGTDFFLGDRIVVQGFSTVPTTAFDLEAVTATVQEDGSEQFSFEFHREGSYEDE